jgi:deoxyribodipyrimidine photo-lyase
MKTPYGVHWFRRDLRVAGNPALAHNWKKNQGRVVGFFCFDPVFLARADFSTDRFAFYLQSLHALRDELRSLGSDLLVLEGGPVDAFQRVLEALKKSQSGLPSLVSFNRDYEPFARARDEKMTRMLQSDWGLGLWTAPDHLLIEPHEIEKPDRPYQVFTPFSRRWLDVFRTEKIQDRVVAQKPGLDYLAKRLVGETPSLFSLTWEKLGSLFEDRLDHYIKAVQPAIALPKAGSLAAFRALESFASKIQNYAEARDVPSVAGTSHLSIYFKNGSLTVAQAVAYLDLKYYEKKAAGGKPKFLAELIWREFYYYILFHFPHVETQVFQTRFAGLAWENRQDWFDAWKQGRTGYPLVDAGMRQLNQTGWMHNRVRMVVSSFLTKDLLIDYRWGERYFMEKLLDGDLAPNNGGWQWAASTGCDPQPYFRIFNPYLQSEKFDPKGDYIKKYIPELRGLNGDDVHRPERVPGYPSPIVDHATQRDKALALYKSVM